MEFVRPGVPPPRPPSPTIRLVTVSPRQPLYAVIVDTTIWGAYVHYLREIGRSQPCYLDPCPICCEGIGKSYKGWVAAVWPRTHIPFVLELTHSAADQVHAIMKGMHNKLRGACLELRRKDERKESQVLVRLCGWREECELPPCFDVVPHLERLWGFDPCTTRVMRHRPTREQQRPREEQG